MAWHGGVGRARSDGILKSCKLSRPLQIGLGSKLTIVLSAEDGQDSAEQTNRWLRFNAAARTPASD